MLSNEITVSRNFPDRRAYTERRISWPAVDVLTEDRRFSERRVTRDRNGAKTVIDTDGALITRPADPASSAWVAL